MKIQKGSTVNWHSNSHFHSQSLNWYWQNEQQQNTTLEAQTRKARNNKKYPIQLPIAITRPQKSPSLHMDQP